MKFWRRFACVGIMSLSLSACISDVWTGASVIYDRHHWYRKVADFHLAASAKRALYVDQRLKCPTCSIGIAVLNGDVLMVGHVPTQALRRVATARIQAIPGKRRFYDELATYNGTSDPILDSWITAKIRSEIISDSSIDPNQFKIVTFDQVVYLMGDVIPEQAEKVVYFARPWSEVKRVVKLFRYYQLTSSASASTPVARAEPLPKRDDYEKTNSNEDYGVWRKS